MLGTGSAFPAHSYNECFMLDTGVGRLLVDAGGGNGIIHILEKAQLDIATIHDFFVTHTHTDHILGAIWIIRRIVQLHIENRYEGTLSIYGNRDVIHALPVLPAGCNPAAFLSGSHPQSIGGYVPNRSSA